MNYAYSTKSPQELLRWSFYRRVAIATSRGATASSSGGSSIRVDSREAIAEGAHEAFDLLLQGVHDLPRLDLNWLHDLVQAEVRPAEHADVAEQPQVGEDQLGRRGEQVAAFALHDHVHVVTHLLQVLHQLGEEVDVADGDLRLERVGDAVAPRPQNYTVKRCATGHATQSRVTGFTNPRPKHIGKCARNGSSAHNTSIMP